MPGNGNIVEPKCWF